ncbi:TIGR01244 family sulfur transferase [Aurantiacibacter rhizosphaerae]|uniref:TIGR01244 family phosphatase n=1 Tax=Aurantiacibacter rhizosphaerae TaxID=2691582 RepID=A0A844XGP2_9SPHN|nr:TIGR01244 family sulfur transferase [Aurantiacibacter rhizosphaerae]MWV28754.1 TIGR01244 family phosphatase [Aurantiacibacter rhizosphaerae]
MSDFRKLTESMWASPQITVQDVADAAQQGVTLLINNRPDDEEEGQPEGDAISAAAAANGMAYTAIPVGHAGFGEAQVKAMADALEVADGRVLAYCRSGTRSTYLWALAQASRGEDPAKLVQAAQGARYDISSITPTLEMLANKARD